ncbi:protoporphyrinogen oxidase [Actinophytocola xinjiangensis]|uniref:Coproporphyrinogen III oxidase n=1 Tax=Actinophytocola xinjiangensis TaxID=485602 RepID=A0A7Z0WQU0_9PSEU|nr:protoporphyrinogen oxidase [Actinophytocola xinjiangensis]OLF13158.1 protoporphyrinogen oxidase [Actinophytocola xinjiangensis]
MNRVVVVGGGVTGLVAAYRLKRELGPAVRITLVEQSERLGGKLSTVEVGGVATDVGAEAFVVRNPSAARLADELGLDVIHPGTASATVRAGGRTVPLPRRTFLGVPAAADAVRGVLSEQAAERVAAEESLPPLRMPAGGDVSVGEVLGERFGRELVDHLVEPLLGGVYAGRADLLGLRATMPALVDALDKAGGSLTRAAARLLGGATGASGGGASGGQPGADAGPATRPAVFGALREGMGSLVDNLLGRTSQTVLLGSPVRELARDGRRWRLELGSPGRGRALYADAVVLAVPPPAARRLLADVAPGAAAGYAGIEVGSMAVVSLAFPEGTVLPDSSGVLLAVGERRPDGTVFTAKAFTHTSVKWGWGPPRLRASVGRVGETQLLQREDEDLMVAVLDDLRELTGLTAHPIDWRVTRWGGALPQYGVGHLEAVAAIETAVADVAGLEVAGASFRGVGIPACVDSATEAARRVAAHLRALPAGG